MGQLKIAWDTKFKKNKKLILVFCGSVSSWIDENILNSADFMGRVSLTISLDELELSHCNEFWRENKDRISSYEKFKFLSISGGVPRYLEEMQPSETAENNIKAMCYDNTGILFNEFDNIFNDIFSNKAKIYKQIVMTLANGSQSFSDICKQLKISPNGVISKNLKEIETSGFICRDYVYSIKTGRRKKLSKYRLKDCYLRYYLKYIEPVKDKINKGIYKYKNLENIPEFETIMGYQFENLVLNNLAEVIEILKIPAESILSASPYFQHTTLRQKACQIDLLISTKNTIYVCEIKFQKKINKAVIDEVKEKIIRLKYPKNISIRPILIYIGDISKNIEAENFFDKIIPFDNLLNIF